MEHRWIDHETGEPQAVLDDARAALSPADSNPREAVLAREVLRLAQRERDLEAGGKAQADRIANLETERADLISERDAWKRTAEKRDAQIIGLEHQVSHEAGEAAIARNETRYLQRLLESSESRGRQYCTELAEKAGEIRELRARIRAGDALRRDLGGENERLRAEAQKLARDGEDMRCLVNDIRAAAPTEPAPGRTTVETIALMESLLKDLRAANRQGEERG